MNEKLEILKEKYNLNEEIRQDELKKAREESYNEATINEKREISKKMLLKNIDIEEIIEINGLTQEEVKKIK